MCFLITPHKWIEGTVNNDVYKKFLDWKAKIIDKDDPQDHEAFCTLHDVNLETLKDFYAKETFQEDLLMASIKWAKGKTPELIHDVYREVKRTKSVKDLDIFLNLVHDLKKKDKEDKKFTQFNFFANQIPDEQYRQIVAREANLLPDGEK